MKRERILTILVSMVLGAVLSAAYICLPHTPDHYVLTAKDNCIPDEGLTFGLHYFGRGDTTFVIVKPTTTTTLPTVGEKEKRK